MISELSWRQIIAQIFHVKPPVLLYVNFSVSIVIGPKCIFFFLLFPWKSYSQTIMTIVNVAVTKCHQRLDEFWIFLPVYTENAIRSLVLSCLDYCNGLLSSVTKSHILRLQRLQNWAARIIFVSPELSSGRDLVIQMSVRRAPSAIHGFLSGAYLGIRMTYLDDIWYVGGSRSEVVHAEFWAWQMPIKYLICIIYAKICPEHFSGTVCPTWMIFGMWVGLGPKVRMVTLMEVKGHQRSNGVN